MKKEKVSFGQRMKTSINEFLNFLWNSKTKEVLGRDGASWAKVSLFYAIFYAILSSAFIGLLAVLAATLSTRVPTYNGVSSLMAGAKNFETGKASLNPGLGFRPQLDPENNLITYSMSKLQEPSKDSDAARLTKSLDLFLTQNYGTLRGQNNTITNCRERDLTEVRNLLERDGYCPVNYVSMLEEAGYYDNEYGYMIDGPLVLIKINKIFDWTPKPYSGNLPQFLKQLDQNRLNDLLQNNIIIKCDGQYAADVDMLNKLNVTYISGIKTGFEKNFGVIPFYYYPYMNQPGYEAPLVFVKFRFSKDTKTTNRVISIVCKAYAANIDCDDKLNRRGMTEFNLYVAP